MNKIKVIGLGALNIDHIYKVERILEDGETVVREPAFLPGGSAANTIYGLAKLGVSTGFIGAIGDDTEGRILLRDFQKVGVDTGQIRVKTGASTGSALCLSDKSGHRSLYILPGANSRLSIADLHSGYINQAGILHISSFADDKQFKILLELIDKLGTSVKVSFSPGALYVAKGLQVLKSILARTYILFLNESEMHQLTGEELKAGAATCLKQGCKTVVVTLGKGASYKTAEATSYIRTAENEYVVESSQKEAIPTSDTTGAGDAFATGFLYGLLNNKSLEECGRLGNIVAQFSIARIGARQGLPSLDELVQRYQQLYNKPL
jgi:ribokinase